MSVHLSTFLRATLAPPLPSFQHLSSPDYTFGVAGLQIGVRESGGLAMVSIERPAAESVATLVPEPGAGWVLLAGLAVVCWRWRHNRTVRQASATH